MSEYLVRFRDPETGRLIGSLIVRASGLDSAVHQAKRSAWAPSRDFAIYEYVGADIRQVWPDID